MSKALFLTLLIAACNDPEDTSAEEGVPSAYAEVLPDARVLVSLPVDFSESTRDREWSQVYLHTASATEEINGLIGGVIELLGTVTALTPSWSSDEEQTAVWGPFTNPLEPTETVLMVHYDAASDEYGWVIGQRPKNAGEVEWSEVVAGQIEAGATATASTGWFAIDFDKLHELDPTHSSTGRFISEYAISADALQARALFEDVADGGDPTSGVYIYGQIPGADGFMKLVQSLDVQENGSSPELLAIHSRWLPSGEGRGDVWVTGGDLGDAVGTLSECWGPLFDAVYANANWENPQETGDLASCAYSEAEFIQNMEE